VWDPLVRLFHWLTVGLFAVAFLASDYKWIHEPAGYALLALVLLRIVWGFVGPRYARFSGFVAGPGAVLAYLRAVATARPPRYLGHNPAGGAMILLLMAMLLIAGVTGWMSETDRWFGVDWVSALHHLSGNLLLPLAGVHVLGVLVSSLLHRENLVRAMITGRKPAGPALDGPALHGPAPGGEAPGGSAPYGAAQAGRARDQA